MVSVLINLVHMCGYTNLFVFLIYFFIFMVTTHSIWKFLGQGLNPSCRCGSNGSFNILHLARHRTRASPETQAAAVGFLTHCTMVGTTEYKNL